MHNLTNMLMLKNERGHLRFLFLNFNKNIVKKSLKLYNIGDKGDADFG